MRETPGSHRAATAGFSLPAPSSAPGLEGAAQGEGGHLCRRHSGGCPRWLPQGPVPCLSSALGVWLQSQEKGKGPRQLPLGAGKPSERFPENTADPEVLSATDRGRGGEPQGEGQWAQGAQGAKHSPLCCPGYPEVSPDSFCASCPGGGPSHRGHTGDPRAVLHR